MCCVCLRNCTKLSQPTVWNCCMCWSCLPVFYVSVCSNHSYSVQTFAVPRVEALLVLWNIIYRTQHLSICCRIPIYIFHWRLTIFEYFVSLQRKKLSVSRTSSNFQWFPPPHSATPSPSATWSEGHTHECNAECWPVLQLLWASVYNTHFWWVRVRALVD